MKNILLLLIITFVSLTYSFSAKGETLWGKAQYEISFKHLHVEDGLSSNVTSSILQDKRGFLWFGTDAGLNRYDGFQIKTYSYGGNKENSLSNGVIKCLFEDTKGIIWIGTERGLNRYNPVNEDVDFFLSKEGDPHSLSNNTITSITIDQSQNLWVGTFYGINKLTGFNKKGKPVFERINHAPDNPLSLSNDRIYCLFTDNNGNIWVGTEGGGLNLLTAENIKKDEMSFIRLIDSNSTVYCIYQVEDGSIYAGTDKGLRIIKKEDNQYYLFNFTDFPEKNSLFDDQSNVFSLTQDKEKRIWIGTFGDGLSLVNPSLKTFENYRHQAFNPQSLSRDYITTVYSSQEGILWIATRETGIDMIDPYVQRFIHLTHKQDDPNSLSNKIVKSISEGVDGRFWFGTFGGGLNVYDPKSAKFKSYTHSPFNRNSLSSDIVESIAFDHLNRFWIGTSKGLNLFNPEKNKFTRFENDPSNTNSLINNNIWSVVPSKDKKGLWIATYNGLDKYDWEKNKFYHFKNDPQNPSSLSFNFLRTILEDNNQNLWIGTWGGGLDRVDLKKNPDLDQVKFKHYRHFPEDTTSISSDLINTIFMDHKGRLWVGTQGGLNLFNRATGSFIRFTVDDGLTDNVVKGILEDEQGNLWISTQKGMSKFNPSQKKFTNYYKKDGLQGDIFNLSSCFLNSSGEMMFGGNNGVSIFKPEEIRERTNYPYTFISKLKVNNQDIVAGQKFNGRKLITKALNLQKEVRLNHDENTISVEFSAIEYSSPEKIQFAYRLDGVDTDWNHTDYKNRQITYSGLNPGKYEFIVKTTNLNNEWGQNVAGITFNISPPFWATKLAYVFYSLLFISFVFYLSSLIRNRIYIRKELQLEKEEHQRKIELNQFKLRFFTNISHEIRTPLTLISIPLQKILHPKSKLSASQKQAYLETMDRNVQTLQRLVNQLLDFRKAEQGKMKLQVVKSDICELITHYSDSFRDFAHQKQISLSFESSFDECMIYIDTDKFEKIIYNLLSNAIKYSPSDKVIDINLHSQGEIQLPTQAGNQLNNSDFICISIQDQGIGIPEDKIDGIFERFTQVKQTAVSETGTGIGLALTKNFITLHKGFISVESVLGEGSTFYIWLPAMDDFYSDEEILESAPVQLNIDQQVRVSYPLKADEQKDPEIPEEEKKEHTILVVEDHPDMRTFIKDALKQKYNILEAENGKEGLETALTEGPDLVISDVMMPVMDGLEFCRKLKKNVNISHIPVIMLTAKSSIEHEIEGLDQGADQYISKPFNIEHLLLVVRNQLEARKKMQQKFSGTKIPEPKEITVTSSDEKFFIKVTGIIEKHIDDSEFTVEILAQQTGLSTVHLYRKLKSITGMSTNEFIRSFKMKRAAQLLKQNKLRVSEVAFMVGFNDPKYFRKCFKNEFGKSPSEYAKDEAQNPDQTE